MEFLTSHLLELYLVNVYFRYITGWYIFIKGYGKFSGNLDVKKYVTNYYICKWVWGLWDPLGKECLKLFCIYVYMEISIERFWQRMFEIISYMCMAVLHGNFHLPWTRFGKESLKLFCILVRRYYIKISIEPFWYRMFETILYTCMVLHGNFRGPVLANKV